jgi:hypothetical protein
MLLLAVCGVLVATADSARAAGGDEVVELLGSRAPEVDSDGDGRADVFRSFDSQGRITRIQYDLNADGKADEEVLFGDRESVRLRDGDLDGEFDERVTETYSGERLLRQTTESKTGSQWRLRHERRYLPESRSFQVIDFADDGKRKGERLEPADLR